ncbi:hypothetical protein TGMAS_362210 [Toxoplasma gondii MAS]|uniref:Uncharacterized protein n=1 Tax=Toxoplasma gondii MAS TaxID=943118 RepID=A0A086PH74_TOXGO|nr:hypothetical protein TGMAS_362210 [Toxoplasma gondii MAS]
MVHLHIRRHGKSVRLAATLLFRPCSARFAEFALATQGAFEAAFRVTAMERLGAASPSDIFFHMVWTTHGAHAAFLCSWCERNCEGQLRHDSNKVSSLREVGEA